MGNGEQRRGRGRPPVPRERRVSENSVTVYFVPEDYEAVEIAAKAIGVPISEWLRNIAGPIARGYLRAYRAGVADGKAGQDISDNADDTGPVASELGAQKALGDIPE